MKGAKSKYTPREYQSYILSRIRKLKGTNVIVELDCGLGKRFITHQLVTQIFPNLRFIIIVHSSSSLAETIDYLRSEYGGLEDVLGELSSRIRSPQRPIVLKNKRVVVATPQVLAKLAQKYPELLAERDNLIGTTEEKEIPPVTETPPELSPVGAFAPPERIAPLLERTPTGIPTTPSFGMSPAGAAQKTAEERFNELIRIMSEEEAYSRLAQEGYR